MRTRDVGRGPVVCRRLAGLVNNKIRGWSGPRRDIQGELRKPVDRRLLAGKENLHELGIKDDEPRIGGIAACDRLEEVHVLRTDLGDDCTACRRQSRVAPDNAVARGSNLDQTRLGKLGYETLE